MFLLEQPNGSFKLIQVVLISQNYVISMFILKWYFIFIIRNLMQFSTPLHLLAIM